MHHRNALILFRNLGSAESVRIVLGENVENLLMQVGG
jgi:hypothetical protein